MKYLITYDIENNKKRKKLSDELEAYGIRVNYSVFECEISKTKLKILLEKIEKLVDKKYDSVRFYSISKDSIPKSFELCNRRDIFEEDDFFV